MNIVERENTLEFARLELNKYWEKTTGNSECSIALTVQPEAAYWGEKLTSSMDDAYHIDVTEGTGQIIGSNDRSVLLGVYGFFTELGCCFYAPGEGGESIALHSVTECTVHKTAIASLRHRGICIEGADSLKNILDMIDWLPKNGFNSYFIQFREGYYFFEKWYSHSGNTCLSPEPFDMEICRCFIGEVEAEIKRRGLIYHKVGHGWTSECLGIQARGWMHVEDSELSDEIRPLLAQVGGQRKFFDGVPINTNLCYSNPEVQQRFVHEVVQYAKENPQISLLHIWLADNYNNMCECHNCKNKIPTDWYVGLLNEIDRQLTELKLTTRLVFLIYFELLWPPQKEKIINPDRFVLMFAPITRTYSQPFCQSGGPVTDAVMEPLPEYRRNHIQLPKSVEGNLSFLKEWQKQFAGDSFDYDYHLMWDIDRELGGLQLARVIYEDCISLHQIKLNGLISCQRNRASFPTGICQYVMGQVLFNTELPFEQLVSDYFEAAYGKDAKLALEYVKQISERFPACYFRGELKDFSAEEYIQRFLNAKSYILQMEPEIDAAASRAKDTSYERMWEVLQCSLPIHRMVAAACVEKLAGVDQARRKELSDGLRELVSQIEQKIQPDLDGYQFCNVMCGFIEA